MAASIPVGLIYNTAAGTGPHWRARPTPDAVALALREAGGEPEMLPTRGPGDGVARGREAAARFPVVAVLGGDGTVNEVINGVVAAGGNARLLILPGGSVNVLARDLRVPLDPRAAAGLLRHGAPRRLYLGRAGRRYFALMAGAGLDASIVRAVAAGGLKRHVGTLAFVLEGLRHSRGYAFPRLRVDSEAGAVEGYLAIVGNSPGYAGYFSVTPKADAGRPGFQVAVCTSRHALKYFYFTGLAFARRLGRSHDFVYLDTSRLRISSESPAWVQVDGEPHEALPMDFVAGGASLEFLAPA